MAEGRQNVLLTVARSCALANRNLALTTPFASLETSSGVLKTTVRSGTDRSVTASAVSYQIIGAHARKNVMFARPVSKSGRHCKRRIMQGNHVRF